MRNLNLSFSYENPLKARFDSTFFAAIPESPGVYFMHGKDGQLLYIGKARSLRARLSSYRQAKPGSVGEHILELLESAVAIRWKIARTEAEACLRESELIHAIRPPFNIAGTQPEHYLFIGYRRLEEGRPDAPAALQFRLTSHTAIERDAVLFGCYKHRRRTKTGYTALLRLLHAARSRRPRFSYPARITRASPPYSYTAELPGEWLRPLERFLSGQSPELLRLLVQGLLDNECVPPFMYASLQEDITVVRDFYRRGPYATRQLRKRNGVQARLVSPRQMDELIAASVEEVEIERLKEEKLAG